MIHQQHHLNENNNEVVMTTYLLKDSPELLNGQKRPVVIVCPGGAYLMCSDREAEPVALRFNAMGYHAVVLRYSVLNQDAFSVMSGEKDISTLTFDDEKCYPAPIRDIGRVMLWLHENADAYHIDMDQVALCGFSAGGHNVLMYGTYWHRPVLSEYFGVEASKFKPAAVIAGYPLSDYTYMKRHTAALAEMDQRLFALSNRSYIGTEDPTDEQLVMVSPAKQVSDQTPPMFIWATSEDTLVPVAHTILMTGSLAERGIPFESHIFENGPHGLSLADQSSAGAMTEIMPDVATWIDKVETWLGKRFHLTLPERTMWG